MTTIITHRLVPEYAKPRACSRLRCGMDLRRASPDEGPVIFFVHTDPDGSVDEYPIPLSRVDDPDANVSTEAMAWAAGLHEPTR